MAQTDLECANGALTKIGASRITALAGTDHVSVTMNERLPICKKAVLRMHPWNFAVKRKKLRPYQTATVSNITLISAELLEVTHVATTPTYAVGNWVEIKGVSGATEANGTWEVQAIPAGTTTRVTAPGVTSLTTYIASTADSIRRVPAFEYSYLYALPTDCLRVLRIDDMSASPRWRIEGGFILSDIDDELEIKYVYDVTDYATMDSGFYEVLQTYLAHDVAYRITQSSTLKEQMAQELRALMGKVRFDDSTEDSAEQIEASDWLVARGSSSWFDVGRF